jgi:hypothetical protein
LSHHRIIAGAWTASLSVIFIEKRSHSTTKESAGVAVQSKVIREFPADANSLLTDPFVWELIGRLPQVSPFLGAGVKGGGLMFLQISNSARGTKYSCSATGLSQ